MECLIKCKLVVRTRCGCMPPQGGNSVGKVGTGSQHWVHECTDCLLVLLYITVLFPGPCTCAILQYLSPKLQTAITHSILNRFLSFLGCGLAFIYTKCMQIYRV